MAQCQAAGMHVPSIDTSTAFAQLAAALWFQGNPSSSLVRAWRALPAQWLVRTRAPT